VPGAVIVWDRGTWEPLVDPHEGLERGNLKFALAGEKLRGAFVLVRMKPKPGERGENWLLIKERDEHVRPRDEYDVLAARPESVASGRTVEQVASAGTETGGAPPGAPASVPAETPFQLATLSAAPPAGEGWLHEIKYDGYRVRLAVEGGAARVLTRGGEEWSDRMGALARAAAALPVTSALIDGEAVVFGRNGAPDFGALQAALSERKDDRIVYLAFDLLHLDGRDLRTEPLSRRKELLRSLLERAGHRAHPLRGARGGTGTSSSPPRVRSRSRARSPSGPRPRTARAGRPSGARPSAARQEFVVGGFTGPRGSRTGLGALLLGYYDAAGTLHYAGRVGSGFSERDLTGLTARLEPLVVDDPPFSEPPRITGRTVRWVRPEVVVEVEFAEWTASGVLRQPVFLGVREDRDPSGVHRDEADAPQDARESGSSRPRLTNPDKELFESGPSGASPVTKAGLATYYEAVASAMLPDVAGRPLSIVRCPHGQAAECFFQKHPDARSFPSELRVFEVPERTGPARYFAVEDLDGLLALVQLGVVEIHAWNSHADTPETPDRIVFDLDPGPDVEWPEVLAAARTVRAALGGLGLSGFAKTTGGHGLHVVTPIVPEHDHDTVRAFARGLVDRLVEGDPDRFTARMAKAARPGKVFVDYLRNAHGATAVAAYSTRARPGAPVAVPVTWEELATGLDPLAFDTVSVPLRVLLARDTDPWTGYEDARAELEPEMFAAVSAPLRNRPGTGDGAD
jgi:bifunctional non-homologous end joining protein LigD